MKACLFLLVSVILLTGCRTIVRPPGEPLFYVKMTQNGFRSESPGHETGSFFYSTNLKPNDIVIAFQLFDGRVTGATGGDTGSTAILMQNLAAIDFEPFDFDAEVKAAVLHKKQRMAATGKSYDLIEPYDGAEFEIGYNGPKGKFVVRKWNLHRPIEELAGDSEKIDKLNRLIHCFAEHYGMAMFRL